jgi:hypothetical protein
LSDDFWARALREASPQPAAAPPANYQAPPPGTPWWQLPTYQSAATPAAPAPHQVPGPQDLHPLTAMPKPVNLASARNASQCPGCGGDQYFKATPNSSPRCFECGYPVQHSTSGLRVSHNDQSVPTKVSMRQVTGNGFQPQTIVGHV